MVSAPDATATDAPKPPELATDAAVAETPASIDESVEKPTTDSPSSTPPAPLAVSAGAAPAEADTADGKEDADTDETASQGIQPLTDDEQGGGNGQTEDREPADENQPDTTATESEKKLRAIIDALQASEKRFQTRHPRH